MERNGQRELKKKEQSELICPHHKVKLVLRESKHGVNRGTKFWGCPTWSKTACNYTIPYESFKKMEPTIKEKFLAKIKNKKGKISPLKIVGFVLMSPIYIFYLFLKVGTGVRSNRKRGF